MTRFNGSYFCKLLFTTIILFASSCWGSDIVTGKWLIKNKVYSSGYISRAPRGQAEKMIGNPLYLGQNYLKFKGKKYVNLVQNVEVLSDDEIFKGWHIYLSDLGVNDRSAKIINYKTSYGDGLPFSEFILTSTGDLIAITEVGLFKLVRINQ